MVNKVNDQKNDQDEFVVDDLFLVNYIWHFKVDDGFGWKDCAGMLKNYLSIEIAPEELKERFQNYFDETMGIKPYTPCPCCNSELVPRESRFGRFIGCSAYPKCKFKASRKATRK